MDMHCPGSKSDEQLAAAIAAYLEEHPIDAGLDEAALAAAIAAYLEDHPIDAGLDEAALAAYLVENGYLKNTDLADAVAQALADAKASGEFDGAPGVDGADGVGIQSVAQTTTSTEDGGTNIVTVTKTDGTTSTFKFKNGSKGSDGAPGKDGMDGAQGPAGADGYTPVRGVDYWTDADQQQIVADVLAALPDGDGVSY